MTIRLTLFAVLAASALTIGCSNAPQSTLAPSAIPDFTPATAQDRTNALTLTEEGADPAPADDTLVSASEGVSGTRATAAATACSPSIVGPSRISATFKVRVVPCGSWKLESEYLTKNGNWWNVSILINKSGTHWSSVNDSLGSTTVTVDLSKLAGAFSGTQFRLVLTSGGKTATYRFTYRK